jgi:hypothetical protein
MDLCIPAVAFRVLLALPWLPSHEIDSAFFQQHTAVTTTRSGLQSSPKGTLLYGSYLISFSLVT